MAFSPRPLLVLRTAGPAAPARGGHRPPSQPSCGPERTPRAPGPRWLPGTLSNAAGFAGARARPGGSLTGPSPLEGDVGQQVVARDDPQQLQHLPEVGLVAAALPLQRQQEVPAAADHPPLVVVDHVHEEEGEHSHVAVGQVGAHDVEHAVQAVQPVLPVAPLLRPGLCSAPFEGGHLPPLPARAEPGLLRPPQPWKTERASRI